MSKENNKDEIVLDVADGGEKYDLPFTFCKRCGHIWVPRSTKPPKACPKCKKPTN